MKPRAFSLAVCLLLALGIAPIAAAQTPDLDPRIQKLLSEISEARLASQRQSPFLLSLSASTNAPIAICAWSESSTNSTPVR